MWACLRVGVWAWREAWTYGDRESVWRTLCGHPGEYSVTAFPAQKAFCTCPVAHQGNDLALTRPPLQGSFGHLSAASTTVFTRRAHQHRKGMTFGPRFARVGCTSIHQTNSERFEESDIRLGHSAAQYALRNTHHAPSAMGKQRPEDDPRDGSGRSRVSRARVSSETVLYHQKGHGSLRRPDGPTGLSRLGVGPEGGKSVPGRGGRVQCQDLSICPWPEAIKVSPNKRF